MKNPLPEMSVPPSMTGPPPGEHQARRWPALGRTILFFAALTAPTAAQETRSTELDPPALVELREAYHQELAEAFEPTVEAHDAKLADVEQEAAARGDYPTALEAKARRDELHQALRTLGQGGEAGFQLAPEDAELAGAVSFERSPGTLTRWTASGSRATWEARRLRPGTYEVTAVYAVGPPAPNPRYGRVGEPRFLETGGTFTLRESSGLNSTPQPPLTATVADTGGWGSFENIRMGEFVVESTAATLSVEAAGPAPGGLMALREIRFEPAASPSQRPTQGGPPPALAALNETHADRIATLTGPVRSAYAAALDAAIAEHAAAGELDTAIRLQTERERIGSDWPLPTADDRPAPASPESFAPSLVLTPSSPAAPATTGDVVVAGSGDFFTHIRPEGASIEWDLGGAGLGEGFYEVSVRARVPADGGGSFSITAEGGSSFSATTPPPRESKGAPTFHPRPVGVLYLGAKSPSLKLEATALMQGSATLFDLQSVELRRVSRADEGPPQGAANTPPPPAPGTPPNAGSGGFVRLDGPTLLTSSPLHGDDFWIAHEGGQVHLRVYGADAPRSRYSPNDPDYAAQAAFFGLDDRRLREVGRDAVRFTRERLEGKPFIVFTRHEDAGAGRVYAFVVTGDGLLSQGLIRNGLALSDGATADVPDDIRAGLTAPLLELFLAGEQDKAEEEKLGLWKYRSDKPTP